MEVPKHIPRFAGEYNPNVEPPYRKWEAYWPRLHLLEPDPTLVDRYRNGIDPKNADFVALAETLATDGILSRDRHIHQVGGTRLTLDFVLALRGYSRATSIGMNIKCAGLPLGIMGSAVSVGFLEAVRGIVSNLNRLPDWVKIAMLLGGLLIILHPRSRQKVSVFLTKALVEVQRATPHVIQYVGEAAFIAQQYEDLAEKNLKKAFTENRKRETATKSEVTLSIYCWVS